MQVWFHLVASGLLSFGMCVLTPKADSVFIRRRWTGRSEVSTQPLTWTVLALFLAGWIYFSHLRSSAALIIFSLCLAFFDRLRYRKTNTVSI